jgi:hypothetical protein
MTRLSKEESRYPGELGLLPNGKPTLEDAREFHDFAAAIYNDVKKYCR